MSNKLPKINKILFAETKNKYYAPFQHWYFPLKENCKQLISFDTRWNSLIYGKQGMNKRFLEFVKKEKPDYIFLWTSYDGFYFDTLLKIREISPKTKVLMFFGDDDSDFETSSRYLILFLDYGLIGQNKYVSKYKKERNNNVFFTPETNTDLFKPLNIKKEYDVVFIGSPKTRLSDRYKIIKFLKESNINLKLFGWGWENYSEFKDIYGGALNSEEMVKVLNKTKIYLCLSKNNYGKPQIKGKVFEGGSCKTFVLTEYYEDYLNLFEENKEIVMFKNKKELLEKIKYYLKNEKQRKKIEEAAYKKIINKYGMGIELKNIFKKIHKPNKNVHKKLPKINKKIICLFEKDLHQNLTKLKFKLKDYDYIFFKKEKSEHLKYKEYLQSYSLEKSNKPISCCDYYVHNRKLGDYLCFDSKSALKGMGKKYFISFLNINQLMVTKNYFLKNINKFRKFFRGDKIDIINEANTVFVSFPLIRINKFKAQNYKIMRYNFDFRFLSQLYSLKYRRKIFTNVYVFALILEILKGKKFILKAIIKTLKDKGKRNKLKSFQE